LRVAYVVQESETQTSLRIVAPSSGESTEVLATAAPFNFNWSPDGQEVALISECKISVVSLRDGVTRRVCETTPNWFATTEKAWVERGIYDDLISYSPDGTELAFVVFNTFPQPVSWKSKTRLFKVPVRGGEVVELAEDDLDIASSPCWSPDGKWISFRSNVYVAARPATTIWELDLGDFLERSAAKAIANPKAEGK
jgi:Tol biopolymer transport system component